MLLDILSQSSETERLGEGGGGRTQCEKHTGPYGAMKEGLYLETLMLLNQVFNVTNTWCI
jgi:hypothetical protein